MSENLASSSVSEDIGSSVGTLLDLVLDSTEAGSGIGDFLAELAAQAAATLSRPQLEICCGITLHRAKQASLEAGSTGEGSAGDFRIHLVLDGGDSAVVNFHSPQAEAFSPRVQAEAQSFAADASRALLLGLRISRLNESRQDLAAAMQSRTIIDMAIGAVMAQNRCRRDAAFQILRNTSNNRNLKIRDVAAAVVASIAGDTDITARFQE